MKIVTIIGARPQFIKVAAVSRAIAKHNETIGQPRIREIIVHTGQHYDTNMSQVFFDELNIPRPDYNLEVGSGRHGEQTGAMLAKIEEVLLKERPDFLFVYGDTNSTLAGAVAAVKLHIPSVHVEAGLRSFNRRMPEEVNRIIADQTANILLCPTALAVENLKREGIGGNDKPLESFGFNSQRVFNVGDVMYDSVLFNGKLAEDRSDVLERVNLATKGYALVTLHRAENTDSPARLKSIVEGLRSIAHSGSPVVLPLHPRTRKCLLEQGLELSSIPNIMVIEPVGYLDMMQLEKNASIICTDSGGVQKEAFFMQVPCITMRDETEWTETVEQGWNLLAGADTQKIIDGFVRCRERGADAAPFCRQGSKMVIDANPYGDGHASEKIVGILVELIASGDCTALQAGV